MNGHDPELPTLPPRSATGRARDLFELSVSGLDMATGNRLRLLRRSLVARPHRPARRWLLSAGASASAALLFGLAWWLPAPPTPARSSATVPAVADSLPDPDDDAELYAWLGEAPVAVATARGAAL